MNLIEIDPKGEQSSAASKSRFVAVRENRISSQEIFVDTREIIISHGDEIYRLRLTAQNKLILTK